MTPTEVAARTGQPVVEKVPKEGPAHQSCPQPEARRIAVGATKKLPSSFPVDGRHSAPSAPLPSSTKTLATVLPPAAAPLWGSPPTVQPLLLASLGLLAPVLVMARRIEALADLHGSVRFGLKIARIERNSHLRPSRQCPKLELFSPEISSFGPTAHTIPTETAPEHDSRRFPILGAACRSVLIAGLAPESRIPSF